MMAAAAKPKQYMYKLGDRIYGVMDHPKYKAVEGPDYKYRFDKKTGFFARWGKDQANDPLFSPIGPELLGCEISINGCPNANNCAFCYKNNQNIPPTNMSLATFKTILDKFPKTLTQIAFGITGVQTNPDFIPMMEYCRSCGYIPNFTLSGIDLTDDIAKECARLVGALAVSAYQSDKNVCYDTVKKFVDMGLKQTNIHIMVSEETEEFVYEVLNDRLKDPRLQDMNAIVLLAVKPKGRAKDGFHPLNVKGYQKLIKFCFDHEILIGFDSCTAPKFEKSIKSMDLDPKRIQRLTECSESCESGLFSSYINVLGEYWHCSFAENEDGQESIDVVAAEDFLGSVWYHPMVIKWRRSLIENMSEGCRQCNIFQEIN